jgi:hypothetical protein
MTSTLYESLVLIYLLEACIIVLIADDIFRKTNERS